MGAKKVVLATIAGGVALFARRRAVTGFLLYGVLLRELMAANTAAGTMKEMPDFPPLIFSNLVIAAFLTLILSKWDGARNLVGGVKAGIPMGLLLGLGIGLALFATTNMMTAVAVLIDTGATAIRFAAAGGAIGAVLGRQ